MAANAMLPRDAALMKRLRSVYPFPSGGESDTWRLPVVKEERPRL